MSRVVKMILSNEEHITLKELMGRAPAYDALVAMIGRHALDAMQATVYAVDNDRDFRAGYAAALMQLREALVQAKSKVYNTP